MASNHSTLKEKLSDTTLPTERAFLVGVGLAGEDDWSLEDSLAELEQLAISAGLIVVGRVTQRRETPDATTFIGKGKVEEIRSYRQETPYDVVLFDNDLSPSQQRRLEDALGVRVLDRTALILDIFARRAQTHEGRLQVELAQYQYYLPRLTRLWTHLSRQGVGGVGLRGPGETQLESDRRRIRQRIADLKQELEPVRRHRALYRARRKAREIPVVALVGYTNAGKSTLLNALSGADVFTEDRLFATLDPTTRRVKLPSGQTILVTDTVGFIQKLPTQLIAAFRATLEELTEADILVHVLDITHRNAPEQTIAVLKTIRDLDLADKPMITALNKIDLFAAEPRSVPVEDWLELTPVQAITNRFTGSGIPSDSEGIARDDIVPISARYGIGLTRLLDRIGTILARDMLAMTVCIPYTAADKVALFHEWGQVTVERFLPEGTWLQGRLPRHLAEMFRPFIVATQL